MFKRLILDAGSTALYLNSFNTYFLVIRHKMFERRRLKLFSSWLGPLKIVGLYFISTLLYTFCFFFFHHLLLCSLLLHHFLFLNLLSSSTPLPSPNPPPLSPPPLLHLIRLLLHLLHFLSSLPPPISSSRHPLLLHRLLVQLSQSGSQSYLRLFAENSGQQNASPYTSPSNSSSTSSSPSFSAISTS